MILSSNDDGGPANYIIDGRARVDVGTIGSYTGSAITYGNGVDEI